MTDSNSQKQQVKDNRIAVQSARDTTINQGISSDQMREIMECLADQLPRYAAIASSIVSERLQEFETRIIERFANDPNADREAFGDPDFQYLLIEAQKAHARKGDQDAVENLGDLLVERSKSLANTRKALALNRAIETTSLLTDEEISAISMAFALRMVDFNGVIDAPTLGGLLNFICESFLEGTPTNQNSYLYLESLGCGKLSMGEIGLLDLLARTYPQGVLKRKDVSAISEEIGSDLVQFVVSAGLVEVDTNGDLYSGRDQEQLIKSIRDGGFDVEEERGIRLFQLASGERPTEDELRISLHPHCPMIDGLFTRWNGSAIKKLDLSSVGIAIGYVSIKRTMKFKGDIDHWIN